MKRLLAVLMLLSVGAKASPFKNELGGAPYVVTQYGSKLGLEIGSSYPMAGLFNPNGDEELRLSANLAFPTSTQFAGDAAAGLNLGVPLIEGDWLEANAGLNAVFISHAMHGTEGYFGLQSKSVVTWFVSLFSSAQPQ